MKTSWVVVADEAIARLLRWDDDGRSLQPVEALTDPDAHAANAEMRDDAQGRRGRPAGAGSAVTSSAGDSPRHQEAERFARRVAERLGQLLAQPADAQLQIVASPRFLGLLRKALQPAVAQRVVESIDRDLVHFDEAEIARRLQPPARLGGQG